MKRAKKKKKTYGGFVLFRTLPFKAFFSSCLKEVLKASVHMNVQRFS